MNNIPDEININAIQLALSEAEKIKQSSSDVLCSIDSMGKFVKVSEASELIWGYKPAELAGKSYIDMVFEDDAEHTKNTATAIMSGNPVTTFENRYIHKNGTIVPVIWSARWDDKDKLMYCAAKDATGKKRQEKAFENERQRFYDIFLNAPACIGVLKGPNHVYEMANTQYLQLIGKQNIIGKSVKEVLPEVVEQGFIDLLDIVYTTGIPFSANERLVQINYAGNGMLKAVYLNIVYQAYRSSDGNIEGVFFFAVDVTEQLLNRKKIEESEKRYRQIVETAQEGIWVVDENDRTTFVNNKMCSILEYTEAEMMSATNLSFKNAAVTENKFQQPERRAIKETYDLKDTTKSGRQIWLHVSINSIFDVSGNHTGTLAMITDITERKESEIRLLQQKEQLQRANDQQLAILNALPPQIALLNNKGIIFAVNDSWKRFGKENGADDENTWIGKNYITASEKATGADSHYGKSISENIKNVISGKSKEFSMEYPCNSPLIKRWFKVTVSPLMNKINEGAVVFHVDITERKLAEEKLKEKHEQLLASQRIAHIGSWQLNFLYSTVIDSNPIYCSEEAYRIFGFNAVEAEISYPIFSQFVHPDDQSMVKASLEKAIAEKSSCFTDFRIFDRSGNPRWVQQEAKVITNITTGEPVKMFGTIKDITKSKEQELDIQKNTEEREILITALTKSIADLKQFSYITSHNFRSPLSNLISLLGLIDYSTLTEANKEIVEMFETSTLHLNKTINDLIQILFIKNNVNVSIVRNNINELLNDVCASLAYEINGSGCIINRNFKVENIDFHKAYLESILINLLSNAIKYRSPNRPLQIDISTEQKLNREVLMIIKDNGIGIDMRMHRDSIFGMYQRFHSNSDGAGLGLFIVKSQINALGGSIEVKSEVNKGTAFYITFKPKKNSEVA